MSDMETVLNIDLFKRYEIAHVHNVEGIENYEADGWLKQGVKDYIVSMYKNILFF